MVLLKDDVLYDILAFLDSCEKHGIGLPATVDAGALGMVNGMMIDPARNSIAWEARALKCGFLQLGLVG